MIFIVFLVFFFIFLMLVLPWISVSALLRRKTHHAKNTRVSAIPLVPAGSFNLADSSLSLSKAREIFNRAFSSPAALPGGSQDGGGERTAPTVATEGEKRVEVTTE